ncbi:hypothetical protein PFTANZ_01693 [Plasmodium falciparum Tanzania (2000708)]|nr:hypothetical protein PFFCH_01031 [Plasmodium falciparum FCH/4]ETW37611.1 hypothetical protein PFTANZ_01693 [Plasmodium falciparum Tanzania (2000708)]ETW50340.1 hypothetical protein PFMALIP_01643 [Plasmodium falciparum MaliPS096_E11]
MRNSFQRYKNKLYKESNLLKEKFLSSTDYFFLKKLGIYFLIKRNEKTAVLCRKYNKIVSFFHVNYKRDDLFIKNFDMCINNKNVIRYVDNPDIINNTYLNNSFFNKNNTENYSVSFEHETFSKYLSVPLFMKDIFTFFTLSLNKNIIVYNYKQLFQKQTVKKKNNPTTTNNNNNNNNDDDKKNVEEKNKCTENYPDTNINNKDLKNDNLKINNLNTSCLYFSSESSDSFNHDNNRNVEENIFRTKQKKKKKLLLYDYNIINYLNNGNYCLNNYELYIANICFMDKNIKNEIFSNKKIKNITKKFILHKNCSCYHEIYDQFYLLQSLFKNFTLFFLMFSKNYVINNSIFFIPDDKYFVIHKVINVLYQHYQHKYMHKN